LRGGVVLDFVQAKDRMTKSDGVEIYPDFAVDRSEDLMIRGGTFYAVWNEEAGLWSTDEFEVRRLIDAELHQRANDLKRGGVMITVKTLSSFKSNAWADFRRYATSLPDSYRPLDNSITFANTKVKKADYISRRLPYDLEAGPTPAYDKLIGTLYDEDERRKLEWAVGAVICGDARHIQKFVVLYGEAGTGKGTFLNILEQLFPGYYTSFDAKSLGSSNSPFSTEVFRTNPLVAIQHDGDLSKIEDNTKLNQIIAHEVMVMNEKYKATYSGRSNAFLFMGSNQVVKITDAKSGLIRRLIDVHPTGDTLPPDEYNALTTQVGFELGAIAAHCLAVYRKYGKNYYTGYRPVDMIVRTDIFYNFLIEHYDVIKDQDGITLKQAWTLYKEYCDNAGLEFKLNMHRFRDEMKNYFTKFYEKTRVQGVETRSWFEGFKSEKLGAGPGPEKPVPSLVMDDAISDLDEMLAECPAQYAKEDETPLRKWANVTTTLGDLDTRQLHYVKPGQNHIVIDFDLTENGEKSLQLNLEAASMWPPTYAEFSKGGNGIHLHYIYEGDVTQLSRVYDAGIEVKVFTGDSSLRRKLTRCNNLPVATISSGLPLKERRVIENDTMKSERGLRSLILRNLHKEIHAGTKPSVQFIHKILEDAYKSGMQYDVTDLRQRILAFANNSTHHSAYCIGLVLDMKFASEAENDPPPDGDAPLVFYDVEVFPNLFVLGWKYAGDAGVVKMINPTAQAVEALLKFRLVGFNNRRYDNHIVYARAMGYNNEQLFQISQRIVAGEQTSFFGDAYNLSYADIYDFTTKRQSLKRYQIELGLNHQELGLPWDKPVPEELWEQVADYCANDVISTEQVFYSRKGDYQARQILAALSGLSVNDTTQRHTARIIFGGDKKPQEKFVYTELSETFPGYKYDFGKSTYRDEIVGEGGYVYAEPGMYTEVAVLDVASMHPTSIELLDLFGPYTTNFAALKEARLAIKRRDYATARKLLGGKLQPYLGSEDNAKALSDALKIAINIVYGLTSASFDNPFRDIRNKDNIAAKRGALFMIDLKLAVQDRGFKVIHIKTDSIKIPNATDEIIEFVMKFGEKYGYEFEHEVTYEKFCLVNDAVYIAKTQSGDWVATGAQFAEPYVYKTLFTKEAVNFDDLIQVKTVTSAALYLQFGDGEPAFVGRAGAFVPVQPGPGGGVLLRGKEGVYHSAAGAKGYAWQDAGVIRELHLEDTVDMGYYRKLADDAVTAISKFGDFEWFTG
jgi:phage/plasmid-associated DNA primase